MAVTMAEHAAALAQYPRLTRFEGLRSLFPERRHDHRDQTRDAQGRFAGITEASCQVQRCLLHARMVNLVGWR